MILCVLRWVCVGNAGGQYDISMQCLRSIRSRRDRATWSRSSSQREEVELCIEPLLTIAKSD
ncbi:hypothetical protein Plhal304r1_c022g0077841 [Plasmopara halstedii]